MHAARSPVLLALSALLSLAASCAATGGAAGPLAPSTNLNALTGGVSLVLADRDFSDTGLTPLDDHVAYGGMLDWQQPGAAIGYEFSFLRSEDTGLVSEPGVGLYEAETRTSELALGLRKNLGHGGLRPYIGGGVAVVGTELRAGTVGYGGELEDETLGYYWHAGFELPLGASGFAGLDYRRLYGSDLAFGGALGEADYSQVGITVGFRF